MITKEQWLNLVSKVDQTFEDEFKAEYNSPELMFPLIQQLLKQCNVMVSVFLVYNQNGHVIAVCSNYDKAKEIFRSECGEFNPEVGIEEFIVDVKQLEKL